VPTTIRRSGRPLTEKTTCWRLAETYMPGDVSPRAKRQQELIDVLSEGEQDEFALSALDFDWRRPLKELADRELVVRTLRAEQAVEKSQPTAFKAAAAPLNADFYIGLPSSELARCAAMIGPNRARKQPAPGPKVSAPPLFAIAQQNPVISPFRDVSNAAWRQAEIPAANGQANARGIAKIYSTLAMGGQFQGGQLISQKALQAATQLEIDSPVDRVLNKPMHWARGFMRNSRQEFGPHEQAFGHDGAGGSTGFADPVERVAIGYAMNQMRSDGDAVPRATLLSRVVYDCIAKLV